MPTNQHTKTPSSLLFFFLPLRIQQSDFSSLLRALTVSVLLLTSTQWHNISKVQRSSTIWSPVKFWYLLEGDSVLNVLPPPDVIGAMAQGTNAINSSSMLSNSKWAQGFTSASLSVSFLSLSTYASLFVYELYRLNFAKKVATTIASKWARIQKKENKKKKAASIQSTKRCWLKRFIIKNFCWFI